MPNLTIEDPAVQELADELSRRLGKSVTDTVKVALEEKLRQTPSESEQRRTVELLLDFGKRASMLPVLDSRSADEIIGYDEIGVPS